jgi:hypothetical protein
MESGGVMAKRSNVEKLGVGGLEAVRGRLGAGKYGNKSIVTVDRQINRMSPDDIAAAWCGWHIGDESWWHSMKAVYDKLVEDES